MTQASSAPAPDYAFYRSEHRGRADESRFDDALPLAMARLRALAGDDVPQRLAVAYMHAACALVDSGGVESVLAPVESETVGSTSVRYSVSGGAAKADYDAVLPWLSGTGMLCRAVGMRG